MRSSDTQEHRKDLPPTLVVVWRMDDLGRSMEAGSSEGPHVAWARGDGLSDWDGVNGRRE